MGWLSENKQRPKFYFLNFPLKTQCMYDNVASHKDAFFFFFLSCAVVARNLLSTTVFGYVGMQCSLSLHIKKIN